MQDASPVQRFVRSSDGKRLLLQLLAAALAAVLALSFLVATSAQAKDLAVTDFKVSVNKTEVVAGQSLTSTLSFCLPDEAVVGDSFTIDLPEPLTEWTPNFVIKDTAGDVVGEGVSDNTTSPATATVTLTSGFASQEDLQNVCANMNLSALTDSSATPGDVLNLQYKIGDQTGNTTSTVTAPNVATPGAPAKWGWFRDDADQCRTNTDNVNGAGCLRWVLVMPYISGMQTASVTDAAPGTGAAWNFDCNNVYAYVETGKNIDLSNGDTGSVATTKAVNTSYSCSGANLNATFDVSSLDRGDVLYLYAAATPVSVNGKGEGGDTYDNDATITMDGVSTPVSQHLESSYIGGTLTGDHIEITKEDDNGNDANTKDDAVDLSSTNGSTDIDLIIRNTGTTDLRNIVVSDQTVSGTGELTGLSCDFSSYGGPSTGTDGGNAVLPSGSTLYCTATLQGVVEIHQDSASVTAEGNGKVSDSDDYWAKVSNMNLVLAKKVTSATTVYPGDQVTYQLTPSNDGKRDAIAGWSVTDLLPAGLTMVSMEGDGYDCDVASATCTAKAALAAGTTGNAITVTASVDSDAASQLNAAGKLHNVAYVSPDANDVSETNPLVIPDTNTDTDSTATDNDAQADVTMATPAPSIDLEKWDTQSGAKAGDRDDASEALEITDDSTGITFTVTNTGNVALTDVTLSDKTTVGSGTVKDISCPQDTLAAGESMDCTGTLTGVKAGDTHTDNADVIGTAVVTGKSGNPVLDASGNPTPLVDAQGNPITVTDQDAWNGKKPTETVTTPPTGSVTTPPSSTGTTPPSSSKTTAEKLAHTGADSMELGFIALSMLALGGGLLLASRRRQKA